MTEYATYTVTACPSGSPGCPELGQLATQTHVRVITWCEIGEGGNIITIAPVPTGGPAPPSGNGALTAAVIDKPPQPPMGPVVATVTTVTVETEEAYETQTMMIPFSAHGGGEGGGTEVAMTLVTTHTLYRTQTHILTTTTTPDFTTVGSSDTETAAPAAPSQARVIQISAGFNNSAAEATAAGPCASCAVHQQNTSLFPTIEPVQAGARQSTGGVGAGVWGACAAGLAVIVGVVGW